MSAPDAETFERCMGAGGVAVYPADTVYGLACAPDLRDAVDRLYALKGRPPGKPAAVMFFDAELALASLPELGDRTRAALGRLLPGAVTVLLPNPGARFPLACGPAPDTLGLRVPALTGASSALAAVRWPVMQSSANLAGEPDAARLEDVPLAIRRGADLVVDGGDLPGVPSTVLDLRLYECEGTWSLVRSGGMPRSALEEALGSSR